MAKDSFVIYCSFYKPISRLSDKQLGRLFRAIFKYNLGEVVDVEEDIEMAFGFFVNQFEIDEAKYQGKIMRDIENGRKGGNPNFKRGQSNPYCKKGDNQGLGKITQDNPRLSEITQDNPRLSEITQDKAINENDNDNDFIIPPTPQGAEPDWRQRLAETFFSKQAALEGFCMKNRITVDFLRELCEEIFDDWTLTDDKDKSEKHLLNTLRVKLRARNTQNNETDKTDRFSRRRGTDPENGDWKADDFTL